MHGFLSTNASDQISDSNLPCVHNPEARSAAGELSAAECVDVFAHCLERHVMGRLSAFLQEEREAVDTIAATLDVHVQHAAATLDENRSRIARLGQILDQCQDTIGSYGMAPTFTAPESSIRTGMLVPADNSFVQHTQDQRQNNRAYGTRKHALGRAENASSCRKWSSDHETVDQDDHSVSAGSIPNDKPCLSMQNKSNDTAPEAESEAQQNAKLIQAVDAFEADAAPSMARIDAVPDSEQTFADHRQQNGSKTFDMPSGGTSRARSHHSSRN
jgi:hypothetical protein